MPLRELIARLLGTSGTAPNPQEAELRRILSEGDEARRLRKPEEAMTLYQDGLAQARQQGLTNIQEVFLGLIGALHTDQSRYEEAEHAFHEALTLANQSDEPFRRARALLNLGAYNLRRGDLAKAQGFLEESLELARKANDPATTSLALGNLADVFLRQNNPAYALRLLKEAAPQIVQNSQHAPYLLGRTGQAHLGANEPERGRKYLLQAIRMAEQHNQPEQELLWSVILADQLYESGELQEALTMYGRADTLAERAASLPQEYGSLRSLANQANASYRLGQYPEALDLITRVLQGARQEGSLELEASALTTLGNIQQALGHNTEAISALEEAINLYNSRVSNTAERIRALIALGGLYQDDTKALQIFETALESAGEDGTPASQLGRAQTLRRIGMLLQKQGKLQAALEKWTEALSLFELNGDHASAARLLCDTGGVRRQISGINAALPDYERATVLLSHVKDSITRGLVLSNVANVYTDLGEVETAKAFYEESIELARKQGNRRAESLRLGNYGWFHVMTGHARDGITFLESALAISRDLNDSFFTAVQKNNLAQAQHELRDYTTAERLYREALAAVQGHSEPRWAAMFSSNLGRTLLAQGRVDEAITTLEKALADARAAGDHETVTRTLARLAEAYLRQNRIAEADGLAREAETLGRRMGYRKGHADAIMVRANLAHLQGDNDGHLNLLREARRLYAILHDPIANDLARVLDERV